MAEFIRLNKSNCKNCYKCIRNCPVKSIKFSGNTANVITNECILCGQCYVVCPQNAKEIVEEVEKVNVMLAGKDPVIVSIAPSFVANYNGVGIKEMEVALQALGFAHAEETAIGAQIVKTRYEEILRQEDTDVLITSACHSINLLVQKYFPDLTRYLAPVLSPMQAHAQDIKTRNPGSKVVFVGPCIAKKDEANYYEGYVDAVLTYDELSMMLQKKKIQIEQSNTTSKQFKSRFFPTTGGILKSLSERLPNIEYIAIDGVENCIEALKDIQSGEVHNCFIEMSSCIGSCIGGPIMEKHRKQPLRDYSRIANYSGSKDIEWTQYQGDQLTKSFRSIPKKALEPSEEEITNILKKMGKLSTEDELNCGSCGYNTCREKAVAILQGKADLSMCLPFLKEKAESFYNNILNNTPTGIIVTNEDLEVQQINKAALRIINIRHDSDILGDQIIRILDPQPFTNARDNRRNIYGKKTYLAEYDKYIEQTVIYDRNYHIIMCIMRDVTDEMKEKESKERNNRNTIQIADKVAEKQMRIVQEIALLLGETAAETKTALTKLKESLTNE